ncbi:MAG: hypothetical protein KR126chlam2_00047 [Chlamydiae bacterium]|nr:hypothetical protein [Chlamydiota bacterium]
MLEGILILWFILTGLSLIYITYDLIWVTPEAPVMKAGWWLVTLYTGPIGLFLYLLTCKEPMPETHEAFIAPLWKQSIGSEVHCLAGDATGIILAAAILAFFEISPSLEIFIEYVAGFASGLLIFQSLFMKKMMGGNYFQALKTTFYPEWLSMNMIMGGMIPTMVIWSLLIPGSRDPVSLRFWGMMSLASIIGGIAAYPMNHWLVKKGLKHGMTTIRKGETVTMAHHEMASKVSRKELTTKLLLSLLGLGVGVAIAAIAYLF